MIDKFGQLAAPNSSVKTSFADISAYSFGGFLLILPFLPFAQVRFYFAVFTFLAYIIVFLALAVLDLVRILRMGWSEIWQIQYLRIKIAAETQ